PLVTDAQDHQLRSLDCQRLSSRTTSRVPSTITPSMRSRPGIVSLNSDLANGVRPGIEKWRGSRSCLAVAYLLGGAVGPGACRTLFADFRGGAICLFRTHFLGWSGRFFHGCDGSFPRTRAPVPATGSGEPLG